MGDQSPGNPSHFGWTLSQRRALILLLSILFIWLCIRFAMNRRYVSDPQPPNGSRADELASRIDPNTADWQTLAAIPELGEKRAKAIVEYREQIHQKDPQRIVFAAPTDLLPIRGIGQATMENMEPYLLFPSKPASSTRIAP